MSLENELQFYRAQKVELLQHYRGQFVLIKDGHVHGAFTTEQEAYEAGVNRFGNVEMLIQQVLEEDPVAYLPALLVGLHDANV